MTRPTRRVRDGHKSQRASVAFTARMAKATPQNVPAPVDKQD